MPEEKIKSCKQPVFYTEGGKPPMILKDSYVQPIDTHRVQLVPMRKPPMTDVLSSDKSVVEEIREMEDYDREQIKMLHLDSKNRIIGIETISIGTLDQTLIHPRELLKGAILNNASSVIFVHNHPSGACTPSAEDERIYEQLSKAFDIVGIKVLDNIIIGKGCYYSKNRGESCSLDEI